VPGTRTDAKEIIAASSQVELYDEELGREIFDIGIHTLPGMESPFAATEDRCRRCGAWPPGSLAPASSS